jgi:hypothetical protein
MPFQKGNKLGGRTVGALGKETLTKLERKAYFDKKAQELFDEWITKCRPEYGLDQYLGKAKDTIEVIEKKEPSERIKELAKKLKELDV